MFTDAVLTYKPRGMGALKAACELCMRREIWRVRVSDGLWLLATNQHANKDAWRPYSEIVQSTKRRAKEQTGAEILQDLKDKLRRRRKKGGECI